MGSNELLRNVESFDGNILTWAHTGIFDNGPEDFYTPTIIQRRRASFTDKHPLLVKLEEAEEDLKHCDYTAHLLIQRQTRDYAFAVEDTILLLQKGSEEILETVGVWNGDDIDTVLSNSYISWIKAASGTIEEDDISKFAKNIVTISEAVKNLLDEDALAFWTCDQRESILQMLITISKNFAKLKRKLDRIKVSFEEKLKSVRRIAILCECEITGNLVPSDIYYQWVKEDTKWFGETDNIDTARVSIQSITKPSGKSKMESLKNLAWSLVTCSELPKTKETSEETSNSSSYSIFSSPSIIPLKVYPYKGSSKKSGLKILSSLTKGVSLEDKGGISNTSLLDHVDSTQQNETKVPVDEVWTPKPSQKYMDMIMANVTSPQEFVTTVYKYDTNKSRMKEDASNVNNECLLDLSDNTISDEHENSIVQANSLLETELVFPILRKVEEVRTESTISSVLDLREELLVSSNASSSHVKRYLSESMEQNVVLIKETSEEMSEIVNQITWSIRSVERMWLNPPENLVKSKKSSSQELFKLIDFIVDTAKLTENPAFASRVYPEDKHEIIAVLDPVFRELTNCYMSIYVLHNLVVIDINYLKELVTGFPKGNLVVRDWVDDVAVDDNELAELEQSVSTKLCNEIDLEEIFN